MKQGLVVRKADGFEVVFERQFPYPIQTVWNAITKPEFLKKWFTDVDMDFRPGGKITIWFRDPERTETSGKIVRIEAPHLFEYTWEGELASWQIHQTGEQSCVLKLIYSKLADEYAVSAPAGFHTLLDRLENMLDGDQTIHPFGSEENDPKHLHIKNQYKETILAEFPELEKFQPVIKEKLLKASLEKVWKALTDKDEMKKWYFNLDAFRPEKGFEFSFPGQGHTGEKYIHHCKILDIIPYKMLRHTWTYENVEGYSVVTFELFKEKEGTRIKLTHTGLYTFPDDNPDFGKSSFNGGWTELITVLLPQYLEQST